MIEFLRGRLVRRLPARLVIDVGGVGFGVDVSLRTAEAFAREGETVEVITYLHVKEDLLELYGFQTPLEKTVFLKLIDVSGIGPRLALRILSAASPQQLAQSVSNGDVRALTAFKGIGKKTAEVMIATLRAPLSKLNLEIAAGGGAAGSAEPDGGAARDAVMALVTLGVKEAAALTAVQKALERSGAGDKGEGARPDQDIDAGRLIALALREL